MDLGSFETFREFFETVLGTGGREISFGTKSNVGYCERDSEVISLPNYKSLVLF
jgi:hypothetical protein